MSAKLVMSLEGTILSEIELSKPVTVVGRHPGCDIVIDHPAISARHMLLRVVNRTVYVEDLASTNGTRVNGHVVNHQVVHHLDLIEVGSHKLHFFDQTLLAAGVANLEDTVLTDYERTMLAPSSAPAQHGASGGRRGADDLSRTMAIQRDPTVRFGPAYESVSTDVEAPEAPAGAARLALRVTAGGRAGEVIALEKANTMIGSVGVDTAVVVRRGRDYFLARLAGSRPLRLNRRELAPGAHMIALRDELEVGDLRFEVIALGPEGAATGGKREGQP